MTTTTVPVDRLAPMSTKQLGSIREARARMNVWHGAIRSGKTIASLLRWLIYIATAPQGGELVISGKNRDSIYRNVIRPLQDPSLYGEAAKQVHYNRGAPTATILGRLVHVIGANDAKSEQTIRGMTVAGWYADELTVHPETFVTQMLGRMSVKGAQGFGTTNPEGPRHWLKVKYLDRAADLGWRVWHFTIDDNWTLEPSYVASIKAEFTGLWYKRMIEGLWVSADGAIFDMFDIARHVVPWRELPPMRRMPGAGADYGTTNASAAGSLGWGTDDTLYICSEWRHDSKAAENANQPRWTDAQLSTGIRTWFAGSHTPHPTEPSLEWLYVDPSAASLKTQLYYDRFARVADADNDVVAGLRLIGSLFAADKLKIADTCTGLIDEIPGYVWDKKATDKGEDRPVKVDDHSIDGALRYPVASTKDLWAHQILTAA